MGHVVSSLDQISAQHIESPQTRAAIQLAGPRESENAGPLILQLLRLSGWWQQGIKAGLGPAHWPYGTALAAPPKPALPSADGYKS